MTRKELRRVLLEETSTAKLRIILKQRQGGRSFRNKIYAELMRRKHVGR